MLYTNEAIFKRKKKQNEFRKKLSLLIYIILVPLIIYNISLIVQAIVNPQETPNFLGYKTYVIISGSMKPELDIGDVVIVKETGNFEVGDIISFRQGESVVTHRISNIEEVEGQKQYITKGDNNNAEDQSVITEQYIEGEVIFSIPYIGNLVVGLQKGVVVIIILLFIYIYMLYSGNIRKRKIERNVKRIEFENEYENISE